MASSGKNESALVVPDNLLMWLAGELTEEWQGLGTLLGISDGQLYDIRENNIRNLKQAKYQMLICWKQTKGQGASHQCLSEALIKVKRKDLADQLQHGFDAKEGRIVKDVDDSFNRNIHAPSSSTTPDLQGPLPSLGFCKSADSPGNLHQARPSYSADEPLNIDVPAEKKNKRGKAGGVRKRLKAGFSRSVHHPSPSTIPDLQGFSRSVHHPSSTIPDLQGIKSQFLKELKEKYRDLYDAVQPLPYIKDRLYCVDRVFVEGGIEFLHSYEGVTKGNWKNLDSYQSVFKDQRVQSLRRILEGEPGYGKSTVTLQFTCDWCNSKDTSALKDVEIMILLRLRQMGGVSSIYRAIKQFILPKDTMLNEKDIEKIMRNCTSAVVILDGFDEYPDQDITSATDVMNIIARQMFQNIEVVTTTRSSFLPKKYPPLTKRIRLTGFDDKARKHYISKAVVGDDDKERCQKVEESLQENPILNDLCQIPLLFVIFAHMTHESVKFRKLNSVTMFFRYMISCFHSHMKNKMDDDNVRKYELFENEHHKLDKAAFDALCGSSQKIVWKKDDLSEILGPEFYGQYVRIGILVEEEVIDIIDDPGTPITEHVQYKTEVRFYHKLFCEWYAAHYLSSYLQQNADVNLSEFFQYVNAFDVQYLYRFSCGINVDSAKQIITHFTNNALRDEVAILCILEQLGKVDHIKENIRELCSKGVMIRGDDSLLLQRSSMKLLEIAAAKNDIPIEYVSLDNCLQSVDLSTPAIRTTSGPSLTSRIPVKVLVVDLYNRDMTEDEAIDILQFASMCPSLRKLVYICCVPPPVVTNRSTLSSLKSRDVKVWWNWVGGERSAFILNLQTGQWENEDGLEVTEEVIERQMEKKRKREERDGTSSEAWDDEDDSDNDDVSEKYSDTT